MRNAAMDAEAEYNNRARVPNHATIIAAWARDAAAFRAAPPPGSRLGLAYGPSPRQQLDLFGPLDGRPAAVFLHGGYWQALDGRYASHCARGLCARGWSVAVPTHDLCPHVSLPEIVAQVEAALALLARRGAGPLLVMGHSAGGHLAAMMALRRPQQVRAILPVSGVFLLEPLLATSIAAPLRLDATTARALSPVLSPPPGVALHAVVGAGESDAFRAQARHLAAAWDGTAEEIPGADHFTVLAPLATPGSGLVATAAAMLGALA